ncbi:E3 ubiquitin-protein ligase CCNB1IP1 [Colletotrichum chrysophilum]|uniref:E3 ubiquitin-protein ligase CCNB1IP1 n=1 Tax=Colletotrichum chrysophilum TaxID=1836956 RepID=A0AAD9EK98_9PEZI|nr:E3 ubiquitin-protein ligase CCNB1IP1 [Colletotrichum chrysophilum]
MEHPLRCNVRECRREVGQQALVTTCSHIFCVECAARHGLSGPVSDRQRKCPACRTGLQGPDDAVLANLNLNEDYKTSVLSGLSPTVIMECTGRALSFWAYQTSQEDVFQRQTVKKMTAQLKTMERKHQSAISEVIEEKETLQERFQAQILDYSDLRRKYEELGKLYKDKCRRLNQVQDLYDKVKQRVEMGQVEAAASDAVDFQLLGPGPNTTQGLCEHQQEPTYLDPQRHAGPIRVYG